MKENGLPLFDFCFVRLGNFSKFVNGFQTSTLAFGWNKESGKKIRGAREKKCCRRMREKSRRDKGKHGRGHWSRFFLALSVILFSVVEFGWCHKRNVFKFCFFLFFF